MLRTACTALTIGVAMASMLATGPCDETPAGTGDWTRFRPHDAFTFRGPSDLEAIPVQAVDSGVGRYANADLVLSYDYGWYSDPLEPAGQPGYQSESVEIDGRTARIVTFEGHAAVHFADLGESMRLTVLVELKQPSARADALEIFRSIRFP
jgi:hypothetical protein